MHERINEYSECQVIVVAVGKDDVSADLKLVDGEERGSSVDPLRGIALYPSNLTSVVLFVVESSSSSYPRVRANKLGPSAGEERKGGRGLRGIPDTQLQSSSPWGIKPILLPLIQPQQLLPMTLHERT
jgi:hypothetical protein